MTDVLERGAVTFSANDVGEIVEPPRPFDLVVASRVLLVGLSAGAGAIHLAMVPSHWGESVAEGVGFAVCGWLQLVFAAVVLTRPSRALLWLGAALNAAAIGAWTVSRTAGLPFGAHAGHAESAGFIDITCVVFEAVLVVACIAFALRPRIGARHARGGMAVAGIAALGVLALTTAALGSPGARNHAAHSHGDTAATSAGHTHGSTAGGGGGGGHTHGVPAGADDKGFSLLHNGQHEHTTMIHKLDDPTKAELARQLAITTEIARRIPTVAAARAAGYNRVGPYFPGIGAHFMREYAPLTTIPDGIVDDVDLNNPFMLIFNGTSPASRIAGFMYYSTSPVEPAGFVGRNDTWHYHEDICFKYSAKGIDIPYGLDKSATAAQCAALGGTILPRTGYMLHVWSVPGFTMTNNYGGVFGEANPKLSCADGTYYMLPLDEWAAHPLNICKAQ
jgi:hypothetical protein